MRVRHLPGGAARAGSTSGRVLVQLDPPSAAQNGRGGGRGERLNLVDRLLSPATFALFWQFGSRKSSKGKPERARGALYRPRCVLARSALSCVAEDSIATSGGVKVSQSRMSFFVRSKGNSCFSFHQGVGGMQAIVSGWISSHGPSVLWIREGA